MRKIFQICAVFALIISTTACSSSDDGEVRVEYEPYGTWVTNKLTYTAFMQGEWREMEHLFEDMPAMSGQVEGEQITKEIITIKKDNTVELERIQENGNQLPLVKGILIGKIIHFEDKEIDDREIVKTTTNDLSLKYDYFLFNATLSITVSHSRM